MLFKHICGLCAVLCRSLQRKHKKKRFQYKMKDVLLNKILCRQLNIVVLLILLLSELHLFCLSCCFFLRSIIIITLTAHCEGGRTKNIRKKNFFHYNYYVATRQPLMYRKRNLYGDGIMNAKYFTLLDKETFSHTCTHTNTKCGKILLLKVK